jgi:ATP-dependent RNA helicase SUPV3L1/SUV3
VKSNGVDFLRLETSEIKQIAGRAGRYKTAHQAVTDASQKSIADSAIDPAIGLDDKPESKVPETQTVGWVTTLDTIDHNNLKAGMREEPEPITTAGLFPPSLVIERFASYFPPDTPFSYIMLRLHEISAIHPRFHLCRLKDQLSIADCIHSVQNLSVQDRIMLCAAPINVRNKPERDFLRSLAQCIGEGRSGNLLDLDTLPLFVMDEPPVKGREYLRKLEDLHKMLVCYLWLSYRFPNVFTTRPLANYTKKLVEDQIEKTLTDSALLETARANLKKQRMAALQSMFDETEKEVTKQTEGKIPKSSAMSAVAKDILNDARL